MRFTGRKRDGQIVDTSLERGRERKDETDLVQRSDEPSLSPKADVDDLEVPLVHFEQRLDVSLGCDRLSLALFRPGLCCSFVALGSVILVPSRSWGGLGRSELLDGRETLSADMLLEPLSEGFESLGNPGEESVQLGEVWMGEREGRGWEGGQPD